MTTRSGPFWDAVEGRAPVPRAAATLGLEFLDADSDKGTIELAFSRSGLAGHLAPDQFQSTLELNVNFLRPVRPGRVVGKGRVVHREGDMAFIEASLVDSQGALIATATATARVIASTERDPRPRVSRLRSARRSASSSPYVQERTTGRTSLA